MHPPNPDNGLARRNTPTGTTARARANRLVQKIGRQIAHQRDRVLDLDLLVDVLRERMDRGDGGGQELLAACSELEHAAKRLAQLIGRAERVNCLGSRLHVDADHVDGGREDDPEADHHQ